MRRIFLPSTVVHHPTNSPAVRGRLANRGRLVDACRVAFPPSYLCGVQSEVYEQPAAARTLLVRFGGLDAVFAGVPFSFPLGVPVGLAAVVHVVAVLERPSVPAGFAPAFPVGVAVDGAMPYRPFLLRSAGQRGTVSI